MKRDKTLVAIDCEVYRNYFLVLCKTLKGHVFTIKMHDEEVTGDVKTLQAVLEQQRLIHFNGNSYDIPMIGGFLSGMSNRQLKKLSDTIIVKEIPRWKLNDHFPELRIPRTDSIDLMGVTPLKASLKTYGCRIHSRKLQDLPIHPDARISEADAAVLERYCENDVDVTIDIYNLMKPQIELRKDIGRMYAQDMRSMSDPQIAEAAIRHDLMLAKVPITKREGTVKPFKYQMPDFVTFTSDEFNAVQELVRGATFKLKDSGHVQLPDEISKAFAYDGAKYKFGVGGLHSQEKKQVVIPTEDQCLGELDVASYYPSIILGQSLYPLHLGEEFCEVYRSIFDRRIAAKRSGDKTTADTLKIVLNSSYGKFGSKYSFLYAPELLVQTTISGQLALLMLIERVTQAGAKVVSANTDGINVLMSKAMKPEIDAICDQWTKETTYELEWTAYDATYSRDVNSYVALKGGDVKTKGAYEHGSIRKGYAAEICIDAVVRYLRTGDAVDRTILACTDITRFLVMRGVRGGAQWRGQELGKVVRWYYSTDGDFITYRSNGNKVATSDGAKPMMDLSDQFPTDIDYDLYIEKAIKLITDLGVTYGE